MAWYTTGQQANPTLDFILADTGALLTGGTTGLEMVVSSTVAAVVVFEYRNATNTANITSHIFPVSANTPLYISFPALNYAASERFRVRLNAAITGQMQVSLFAFPPA